MKVHATYLASAAVPGNFPPGVAPEVAFVGRSNVGKSSLINSLVKEKIARTSSIPGRTRAINFFQIRRQGQARPELIFVDLPGYGYAKLPSEVTMQWPKLIEPYFQQREHLALVVVLVDLNVPVQASDQQMVGWLRQIGRPCVLVGTKADRLSGNQLRNALREFASAFPGERILSYSARTGMGQSELWNEIRAAAATFASGERPTGPEARGPKGPQREQPAPISQETAR